MLMYTNASPYLKMALVAIPHGFVPVLTLAEISTILPAHSVGLAFGMIEVFDSIVNVSGSVIFGALYNWTGSYHAGMLLLLFLAWGGMVALLCMVMNDVRCSTSSRGSSACVDRNGDKETFRSCECNAL